MILRVVLLALIGLALASAIAVLLGRRRWHAASTRWRGRLEAGRRSSGPRTFDPGSLDGVPAPVRRFFDAALTRGRRSIAAAHLRHTGTFNPDPDAGRWWPFSSEQLVVTARPGFHWDARMTPVPGMTVHVRDAYVAGEGILQAALHGLLPLADQHGGSDLAHGELLRFLAESAWYPTVLLPGDGVRWEAVDEHCALATLTDGDVRVSLQFRFGDSGLIESVEAASRGRMVRGKVVPTPWRGRFWDHAERDGMRVPLQGEVAWLTPEGERPYWRGRLTDLRYEFR